MAWRHALVIHSNKQLLQLCQLFTTDSYSIRFHSKLRHLSKCYKNVDGEIQITLKSYPHISLFLLWRKQGSSHVPACFAIPNDIMHRHEQTHLSVFPNWGKQSSSAQAFYQQHSHQPFSSSNIILVISRLGLIFQVPVIMALYCDKYFSTFTPKTRLKSNPFSTEQMGLADQVMYFLRYLYILVDVILTWLM